MRDYIGNRKQKVKINGTTFTTAPIKYGNLHASILGPILFTIFVHDLAEEIHGCEVIQYADDTQFVHIGTIRTLTYLVSTQGKFS